MKNSCLILIFSFFIISCNNKKTQAALFERNADYYYNIGVSNYYRGNYQESLDNFEKAALLGNLDAKKE